MSTYSQDFNEYTVSSAPSDWTDRWHTTWTTNVISNLTDAYGDKTLELNSSADNRLFLSWDDIDSDANRDDCEILMRFKYVTNPALDYGVFCYCRGSGGDTSETAYMAGLYSTGTLYIAKYVSAASTVIDSIVYRASYFSLSARYVWMRFRVNGTSLKAKMWDVRQPEPNRWHVETTDSAISAAGWVGVGVFDAARTVNIDFISIGTNGDAAPWPSPDANAEISNYKMFVEVATLAAPAGGDDHMPAICINS